MYIIAAFFETRFHRWTGIVAGMSSLLVVFLVIGIVTGMRFPPFVADHGCVFSPQLDDTWHLIDDKDP